MRSNAGVENYRVHKIEFNYLGKLPFHRTRVTDFYRSKNYTLDKSNVYWHAH